MLEADGAAVTRDDEEPSVVEERLLLSVGLEPLTCRLLLTLLLRVPGPFPLELLDDGESGNCIAGTAIGVGTDAGAPGARTVGVQIVKSDPNCGKN